MERGAAARSLCVSLPPFEMPGQPSRDLVREMAIPCWRSSPGWGIDADDIVRTTGLVFFFFAPEGGEGILLLRNSVAAAEKPAESRRRNHQLQQRKECGQSCAIYDSGRKRQNEANRKIVVLRNKAR